MASVVFLDTSILIASFVHPPTIKSHIRNVLSQYQVILSGLVAKQEFCRRFLKEAFYLLSTLKRRSYSFDAVFDHVTSSLPPQQHRKQKICIRMLRQCYGRATDKERADRLRFFLEDLLENGVQDLMDNGVTFTKHSNCKNGEFTPYLKRTNWSFAADKCPSDCGVGGFLYGCTIRSDLAKSLKERELTSELDRSLEFLGMLDSECSNAREFNPCLKVGDLMIAFECKVSGAEDFFTQNYKESSVLCPALGLNMLRCPTNQDEC